MTTFKQFSEINAQRCSRWHSMEDWSVAEWTNALAGEAGEACNVAKKLLRFDQDLKGPNGYHNNGPDRAAIVEALGKELADVVIYADLVAQRIGLDLGEIVARKFNETSEKYGFPDRLPTARPSEEGQPQVGAVYQPTNHRSEADRRVVISCSPANIVYRTQCKGGGYREHNCLPYTWARWCRDNKVIVVQRPEPGVHNMNT